MSAGDLGFERGDERVGTSVDISELAPEELHALDTFCLGSFFDLMVHLGCDEVSAWSPPALLTSVGAKVLDWAVVRTDTSLSKGEARGSVPEEGVTVGNDLPKKVEVSTTESVDGGSLRPDLSSVGPGVKLGIADSRNEEGDADSGYQVATDKNFLNRCLDYSMVDGIDSIEDLRSAVESFDGCGSLKKLATNTVFSDGVFGSDVMIVGEAPGESEDIAGIPFCGRSGRLLDSALGSFGLKRDRNVYITNTVFWRPPGNRKPSFEEIAACRPFLEKHIAISRPKVLVLIGGVAAQSVLSTTKGITGLRGKVFRYGNRYLSDSDPIPAIATFHPAFLLRNPIKRRDVFHDFLWMIKVLQGGASQKMLTV